MRMTKTSVALVASAVFVVAACSGESEPAATDPAIPDLQERVGQLETRLDELGTGSGTADLADMESRLSELESQVDLLSTAFDAQQEPTSLGGPIDDASSSPEAPEVGSEAADVDEEVESTDG